MPARRRLPRPPKERSILGRVTFCVALVVVGLMVGWNAASDDDFTAVAILGQRTGRRRIGLVVGAFFGRARGLIVLGILLSMATSVTAAVVNQRVSAAVSGSATGRRRRPRQRRRVTASASARPSST